MTINGARERISEALSKAKASCEELGLTAVQRLYFTDENFIESSEFTPKTYLYFGELSVSCDGLEDGEECIFAVCVATKRGMIDDGDLDTAIVEFEGEISEFIETLKGSDSKIAAMQRINEKQQKEAEEAAAQVMAEVKKMKRKLFLAIGAIVVLIAAIFTVSAII